MATTSREEERRRSAGEDDPEPIQPFLTPIGGRTTSGHGRTTRRIPKDDHPVGTGTTLVSFDTLFYLYRDWRATRHPARAATASAPVGVRVMSVIFIN